MPKKKTYYAVFIIMFIIIAVVWYGIQNYKFTEEVEDYQDWFIHFIEEKRQEPDKNIVIARVGDDEITNFDLDFYSAINHLYMVTEDPEIELKEIELNKEATISGFHGLLFDSAYDQYALLHNFAVDIDEAYEVQHSIAEVEVESDNPAIRAVSQLKLDHPELFSREARGYYALRLLEEGMMTTPDLSLDQVAEESLAILNEALDNVDIILTEEAPKLVEEAMQMLRD